MVTPGKNVSAHSGDVTSSVGGRIEASLGAKVIRAIGVARIHCADSLPLGTVHPPRGGLRSSARLDDEGGRARGTDPWLAAGPELCRQGPVVGKRRRDAQDAVPAAAAQ